MEKSELSLPRKPCGATAQSRVKLHPLWFLCSFQEGTRDPAVDPKLGGAFALLFSGEDPRPGALGRGSRAGRSTFGERPLSLPRGLCLSGGVGVLGQLGRA